MARRHSVFRPCIDLHDGKVKQIVGGTLTDSGQGLATNYVSEHSAGYYAAMYRQDGLRGGHVIKLGTNCDAAALEAIKAWPNGLHIGGGITDANALQWLDAGAEKVIVTSWLYPDGNFDIDRLRRLSGLVGKDRLVLDLSCRRRGNTWFVATNKWQTITSMEVNRATLHVLAEYCSEYLIHAADVEGLCRGVDTDLVKALGEWSPIACTYAGGGKHISDLRLVDELSTGRVDLTFGSALDIFGGSGVRYSECVEWNNAHAASGAGQ